METELRRFGALLRKELQEHRNLFVITPAVDGLFFLLLGYLILLALPESMEQALAMRATTLVADLPMQAAVIIPVLLSYAFVPVLFLISIIYLSACLYQDRKDRSFLFWQSMPVADWQTVLSRVVITIFAVPAITAVFLFIFLLVALFWLQTTAWQFDLPLGVGKTLLLALDGTLLFCFFAWLNGLLLLPFVGWFLLFSAYARRVPFLWVMASFILLAILEAYLFESFHFGNWLTWNAAAAVFGWSDIPATLFSYDMLVSLALGSILLAGATLMHRFND